MSGSSLELRPTIYPSFKEVLFPPPEILTAHFIGGQGARLQKVDFRQHHLRSLEFSVLVPAVLLDYFFRKWLLGGFGTIKFRFEFWLRNFLRIFPLRVWLLSWLMIAHGRHWASLVFGLKNRLYLISYISLILSALYMFAVEIGHSLKAPLGHCGHALPGGFLLGLLQLLQVTRVSG